MKYSKSQFFQISAAVLLLVGAVFMLVNVFADKPWSFYTGLGFALVAAILYFFMMHENKKQVSKKLTDPSYSANKNNTIEHEKSVQKNQTPEN